MTPASTHNRFQNRNKACSARAGRASRCEAKRCNCIAARTCRGSGPTEAARLAKRHCRIEQERQDDAGKKCDRRAYGDKPTDSGFICFCQRLVFVTVPWPGNHIAYSSFDHIRTLPFLMGAFYEIVANKVDARIAFQRLTAFKVSRRPQSACLRDAPARQRTSTALALEPARRLRSGSRNRSKTLENAAKAGALGAPLEVDVAH